jgi:hypothetical protein
MDDGGVLEVYDNVVFEANTAGSLGGAVSRPSKIDSHLPGVMFCDTACQDRIL